MILEFSLTLRLLTVTTIIMIITDRNTPHTVPMAIAVVPFILMFSLIGPSDSENYKLIMYTCRPNNLFIHIVISRLILKEYV